MAESSNKVLVVESSKAAGSVVAAPKFVFGQKLSDKANKEEERVGVDSKAEEKPRCSEKRCVESDEEDGSSFRKEAEENLSPVKKMAKVDTVSFTPDKEDSNCFKLLKPSLLTEVAKNLAVTPSAADRKVVTSPVPKTFGLTTDTSSTEDSSSRPHSFAGKFKATTQNIFQQILAGGNRPSSSSSSGFVFGQNMSQRVVISKNGSTNKQENEDNEDKETDSDNEEIISTVDSETKIEQSDAEIKVDSSVTLLDQDPKTLAEVAQNANDSQGSQSPNKHSLHQTLAEAAMAYDEEHAGPPKAEQLSKITVVTGEEEERNVLQINCRLFVFDLTNHTWREKGRGILKLNDMCTSSTEGIFQSRLVVRTQGNLRVVLNTKLWPQMTVERANGKSLRVTAIDTDNNEVKIYLIMAAAKEIQRLCTALDRRIEALKRSQAVLDEKVSGENSSPTEDRREHDEDSKDHVVDDDDDSTKDLEASRLPVQVDESSNDSSPSQDPVRQVSTDHDTALQED